MIIKIKITEPSKFFFELIARLTVIKLKPINKLKRKTPTEVHKATFLILFKEFSSSLIKRITKAPKSGRNIVNDSSGISVI